MKYECICKTCGRTFLADRATRSFCSRSCKGKARSTIKPLTCKNCGEVYTPKEANRVQFCGRECAFQFKSARGYSKQIHNEYRSCVICKVLFYRAGSAVTCSRECGRQYKNALSRDYSRLKQESLDYKTESRSCLHCTKTFIVKWKTGGAPKNKWCSKRCKKAADNHRHAGIPKGALGLLVNRQSSKCAICKRRFAPKLLQRPTIDHIVPRVRGGTNDITNLQAACFLCNSLKSDSMGVQLRLCV